MLLPNNDNLRAINVVDPRPIATSASSRTSSLRGQRDSLGILQNVDGTAQERRPIRSANSSNPSVREMFGLNALLYGESTHYHRRVPSSESDRFSVKSIASADIPEAERQRIQQRQSILGMPGL